jgi:hypothetical protein
MDDERPGQPLQPKTSSFGRAVKPFAPVDAAHTIVKVAEELDWNLGDVGKFIGLVQHVEYGLSAEVEFAAILRWLGWCKFVHRLNKEVLEDAANSLWTVPDLLAVFQLKGMECSALIEVKTTESTELRLKARICSGFGHMQPC